MFDFERLIKKHSTEITLLQESGGHYDYENGGTWKTNLTRKPLEAAVFQLTSRDIKSQIQYEGGGLLSRSDIKIYIFCELTIGTKIEWKNKAFTISSDTDYSDHTNGLRIYIGRRADGDNSKKQDHQGIT